MADCVYWQILQAVQTSLEAVVSNVSIRWAVKPIETDTYPLCLVAPGGERVRKNIMPGHGSSGLWQVWWDYPVLVAYIDKGNQAVTANLRTFMNVRANIRDQLYQVDDAIFTGVTGVFDLDLD